MEFGKGLKAEQAETAIRQARKAMDGEEVLFVGKCFNFKPPMHLVVVTSTRVAGLSSGDGVVRFSANFSEIGSLEPNKFGGQVALHILNGGVTVFKSVPMADVSRIEHYVREGIAANSVELPPGELGGGARFSPSEGEGTAYGEEVASGSFGGSSVKIFKNGFVRVSRTWSNASAPYERLVSIEATADVTKKSGFGRGAAAVLTMGVNMAGPNKRGDVYLTIVTDRQTRVLHEEPPTSGNLRQSKMLEAAGKAVLQSQAARAPSDNGEAAQDNSSSAETPTDRLRSLTELRDQGLLSEEEYVALRMRVLDSL